MGGLVAILALVAATAAAAGAVYLRRTAVPAREPAARAELERAVAAVDRELAADLELTTMFDQTKQPFVLENGQFLAWREVLAREAPDVYTVVADLYERLPEAESAMERRGPAGSIREADRALIQAWEGDARQAQRALRAALAAAPTSRWDALVARVRSSLADR